MVSITHYNTSYFINLCVCANVLSNLATDEYIHKDKTLNSSISTWFHFDHFCVHSTLKMFLEQQMDKQVWTQISLGLLILHWRRMKKTDCNYFIHTLIIDTTEYIYIYIYIW